MSQPLASVFVQRRGAIRSTTMMAGVGGVAGALLAGRAGAKLTSPIPPGLQGGFLNVMPDSVVLYKQKKSLLGFTPKPSDEVLGQSPRAQVTASGLKKGKIVNVFQIAFADGTGWEFDIHRRFRKDAEQVAQALGSTVE